MLDVKGPYERFQTCCPNAQLAYPATGGLHQAAQTTSRALVSKETFPSVPQALLLVLALFLLEYVVGAAQIDLHRILNLSTSEQGAFTTLIANAIVFLTLLHTKSLTYKALFH